MPFVYGQPKSSWPLPILAGRGLGWRLRQFERGTIETKTPEFMCFIKETAAEDWRISIN